MNNEHDTNGSTVDPDTLQPATIDLVSDLVSYLIEVEHPWARRHFADVPPEAPEPELARVTDRQWRAIVALLVHKCERYALWEGRASEAGDHAKATSLRIRYGRYSAAALDITYRLGDPAPVGLRPRASHLQEELA